MEDDFRLKIWTDKSLYEVYSICKNISLGGLCFPALQRFEPKMCLNLGLDFPEFKGQIPVKSEVIWLKEIDDINTVIM
ncbi:MAG: PilZ domain-containing protein [Candidatus Omnitrophica bacterium]|nr:PilZ domain-containing protein [Candidatus Omnitrophota bacterium]